jgi:hypothetical protein
MRNATGSSWPGRSGTDAVSEYDGNAAQNRIIAEQLFDIWEERQRGVRSRFTASIPAWIACAFSLATLVWGAGTLTGDIADNTRRIEVVEVVQGQQHRDNQVERDRLARIEAKVDLLIEDERK